MTSVHAPPAPEIAGLFCERLLGVGGRCAVWQVSRIDTPSSQVQWVTEAESAPWRAALKMPLKHRRAQTTARQTLREELEAMLSIQHPHLVQARGFTATQGPPGLLLDLCSGGSLAALLRHQGTLTLGQTVTALVPIAEAVEHLHQHMASHADITAANVLLTPEGRPSLGDFGDSRLLGLGAASGDSSSDIRALAQLVWTAVMGTPAGAPRRRVPLRSLRPQVSADLALLLEHSLDAPASELPSAQELAGELFASAAAEPLDLWNHAQGHVVAEVPTQLHSSTAPSSWWTRMQGFLTRRRRPAPGNGGWSPRG